MKTDNVAVLNKNKHLVLASNADSFKKNATWPLKRKGSLPPRPNKQVCSLPLIDKTSPSIFIFSHPIRRTRSVCSIGHSPNSCAPLFNGLTLDAQRLALGTMLLETKQTRLTYVQVLSSPAPPEHQVAHLQGHAGRILRCVRPSRSGRTFACACAPQPSGLS